MAKGCSFELDDPKKIYFYVSHIRVMYSNNRKAQFLANFLPMIIHDMN
jgi:hypothetical protein